MAMMRRLLAILSVLMMVLASGAVIQLLKDGGARNQGFYDMVEYSGSLNYLPLLWQILVVLVLVFVFIKSKWRYIQFDYLWLGIFTLGCLSVLWAAFPKITFTSSVALLISYLFVNLHVAICGWKNVLVLFHKYFFGVLILSLSAILFLPSYGVSIGEHAGLWQGVFAHKNSLGNFSAMIYLFYLWRFSIERTQLALVGMALSLVLVIGSECSTALINVVVSTMIFGLLQFSFSRKLLFRCRYGIVCTIALVITYVMSASLSGDVFFIFDKDSSFSSRDVIWAYFLRGIESALWLGHGIGQFGALLAGDERDFLSNVGFVVGSAHNGFLESLYALGIVGLGLIVVVCVRLLYLMNDGPGFVLAFLFLCNLLILNMFESMLLGFNFYFIMIMYVTALTQAMSQKSASRPIARSRSELRHLLPRRNVAVQKRGGRISSDMRSYSKPSQHVSADKKC